MPARRSPVPNPAPRKRRPLRTRRTSKKDPVAEARVAFLEHLARGVSITAAAQAAGVGRRTVYEWRAADQTFAEAWDSALDEGSDLLEDEALRRAVHGVSRPVAVGKQVVDVVEYSDVLLIFLLKARRPERYRDNVRVRTEGAVELSLIANARETLSKRLQVNER